MTKTSDVLSGSSLVLSSVTAAWFAMMPEFKRVQYSSPANPTFTDEMRNAEVTVTALTLSFAAIVSFYLKDYTPLLLCGIVLALLTFTYEREFRNTTKG
jgi:hypothetical protein